MEFEPADDYIRRIATFIRTHDKNLAEAGVARRRRGPKSPQSAGDASVLNPLSWFGLGSTSQSPANAVKPIIFSINTHRLFYILMRLEALGIDIGTLDVKIDSPSRPMSYVNVFNEADKSDTGSLSSFRSSFSAVSGLSLGGGWFGRPAPPSVEAELKFIYSSFTKLPALSVIAPGRKMIKELANDPPNENALPLDAFKNLQVLECLDIDPRTLLGWDKMAESLRSLTIKKSGLEDVSDIFVGAVVDDQARREGSTSRSRRRRIPRGMARQPSYYNATRLPESVPEDTEESPSHGPESTESTPTVESTPSPPPSTQLSPLKWAFLKHLSLSDNALTFFPTECLDHLTSLIHLDLSSNLFVSVPPGLSTLYNLISLNLADNMIDSVLGIYTNLGQVLSLNLARNRLESICGLERLLALERVDLRHNTIEDSAEVGRLATLPNITEVWVEGNPFVEIEEGYRIACFDYFWKEGKTVNLDGSPPGFYEKRNLTVPPPQQMSSSRPLSVASSPPVVAVGGHHHHSPSVHASDAHPNNHYHHAVPKISPPSSSGASPLLAPSIVSGGKPRRKKRIVQLDGENSDADSLPSTSHARNRSEGDVKPRVKRDPSPSQPPPSPLKGRAWGQFGFTPDVAHPPAETVEPSPSAAQIPEIPRINTNTSTMGRRSRHSRYQTEYIPAPSFEASSISPAIPEVPTPPSADTLSSLRRPNLRHGSATFSSRSAMRRTRVSASMYEAPDAAELSKGAEDQMRDGDDFRKKIEALRSDMGDGWLKVFSQSQMGSVASG
jgi:Leucine-rich repeat (LRR) protein